MTSPWPPRRRKLFLAASLLLAALAVHFGVGAPARRARDDAREGFARAREARESLRAQAARLKRRALATARAPAGDAAATRALRLALLEATEGLSLGSVRIGAEAGQRGTVAARGRLVAEGRQADLLRAAGRLAEPSSGVVVERVRLAESRAGLRLEIEAFSVRDPAVTPDGSGRVGS
jgi:hypothetical protein